MPKLSIITVNLNNAEGLEKTIRSVISQTFTDYEYIIIDGGSTDGSVEVIKKYADKITYWVSEPDKGIYNAMNKGIKVAKGEWLYFLNSGDWLYDDNVLEKVFSIGIDKYDFVYGNVKRFPSMVVYDGEFSSPKLLGKNISQQAIFYNYKLFIKSNLFKEKYQILADYEKNIDLFVNDFRKKFMNIIISVIEEGGISTKIIDKQFYFNFVKLYKPFIKFVDKKEILRVGLIKFNLFLKQKDISFIKKVALAFRLGLFSKSFGFSLLLIKRILGK